MRPHVESRDKMLCEVDVSMRMECANGAMQLSTVKSKGECVVNAGSCCEGQT